MLIFGYRIDAYLATPGRHSVSIDGGVTFVPVRWGHWRLNVRQFKLVKGATDGTVSIGPVRVVWMKNACRPKRHSQAIAN